MSSSQSTKVTVVTAGVRQPLSLTSLPATSVTILDLTAAHGLTMGAVRQLAATDDSLRLQIGALQARLTEVEARLSRLDGR